MHEKKIYNSGVELDKAKKVLIMLHGRGASASDILSLSNYLPVEDYAILAPEATGNTWYPYSFLMPPQQNEPWLSSAIALIKEIENDLLSDGFKSEQLYFLGFSQGACLTLEFVTRHAKKYGGAIAFTGGLIGDKIYTENYSGDFQNTPIFIGTSDPDPHVPVARVNATAEILKKMNASVTAKIYPGMGHTINENEIKNASVIFGNGQ